MSLKPGLRGNQDDDNDVRLLNSANVWATTKEQLIEFYQCPDSFGITTRTSCLDGFAHNPDVHQYELFDTESMRPWQAQEGTDVSSSAYDSTSSINTLGYSPFPFAEYLRIVKEMGEASIAKLGGESEKPVNFSVTGSVKEVCQCYELLIGAKLKGPVWMEINLSCPNIPGKPPPAYSKSELLLYLHSLKEVIALHGGSEVALGIKVPPYTYMGQFQDMIGALVEVSQNGQRCPIDFITAVNTLGSCLVMPEAGASVVASENGTGIGGLAGAALHPLALGNVRIIRDLLDHNPDLKDVKVIGVGGVMDGAGYIRMRRAGAYAVALGTVLGIDGAHAISRIAAEARQVQNPP
ncbi:dihydroorotate dehydrogenase [Agyrium rufum]|nr:dihydroorotate dehydrogenase [Agyrium rufum]